ncbi:family S53 protease [Trametes coccinea BRFM310]|uniref:tripeptidyl-peptidase II n=1 Tax=Trametes coccinea (strain BRFM310) TaxID=1353009 RepID=A0A1Y2IPN8_TRAC3|nr:family S53 protease [Trametes coccinea BRFM310]
MLAIPLLVASLCVLALGKPMGRNLQLHEAREAIPEGFSLHGTPSGETSLKLRIALVQGDFAGLEQKLYDVSDPSSPNYGNHLSTAEVVKYVAPAPATVDAVNAWLAENDITAKTISPAGDWMSFEVPVSKANELFDADFSVFTHESTGKQYIRTLSYSIPAELQGHLELVHPTVSFPDPLAGRPVVRVSSSETSKKRAARDLTARAIPASCATTITPACLQAIYNIPSTPATVSSNKLAVSAFEGENANQADLKAFLTKFRPDMSPSTTFTTQTLDDGNNNQDPSEAGLEANLDIQYTVGLATDVPTVFVDVGDDTHDGELIGFLDIINFLLAEDAPPQVLTTSYGQSEFFVSRNLAVNLCRAHAQLGARGVSILFASGDGGVSGGHTSSCTTFVPVWPSGCPYVTSVGATTSFGPETAADFSSGGFSNYFTAPSYQEADVKAYIASLGSTYSGLYNASGRGFPDVAAQGVNFDVIVDGTELPVDGTSCSSPTFASVVALLNDRLAAQGKPALGFLNPFLYSAKGRAALNDITTGSNPGCNTTGFAAGSGWDPVTGLGTPDFEKLLAAVL